MKKWNKWTIVYGIVAIMLMVAFLPNKPVYAAVKPGKQTFTIDAAKKLSVSDSDAFTYEVYETLMPIYIEVYYLDKMIRREERAYQYLELHMQSAKKQVVLTGEGQESNQSIEAAYKSVKRTLSEDLKRRETLLVRLQDMTGLDVTGLRLENPKQVITLNRDVLQKLIAYRSVVRSDETQVSERLLDMFEQYLNAKKLLEDDKEALYQIEKKQIQGQKQRVLGKISEAEYACIYIDVYEASVNVLRDQMAVDTAVHTLDALSLGGLLSGDATQDGALTSAKAHYYTKSLADGVMTEFGISIGTERVPVTAYELWVDGKKMQDAVEAGESITVLTEKISGANKAFVRLYKDSEFLCDSLIELNKQSGVMQLCYPKRQEE